MNKFININTEYLSSSRTIETVEVSGLKIKKIFYVYNYDGYSFRVFENVINLIRFFDINSNDFSHFNTDEELDNYFSKLILSD